MKKNRLLSVAINLCRCIRLFLILFFITITFVFIHFQIDKEPYKKGEIKSESTGFAFSTFSKWKVKGAGEDKDVYSMDKIRTSSLYIMYFKYLALIIILFLSFKEFQKVIQSVKRLNTFREDNVKSFRKIGKYMFIFFLLTSYNKLRFQ